MSARLDGRIALVTGAAGEIGRAILERLLEEGATVALADIHLEPLNVIRGALTVDQRKRTSVHRLDVRSDDSCTTVVAEVVQTWAGLDILVNGAGIMVRRPALETDSAQFQAILDVNLTGAYRMARASHSFLSASGRGNVVSVSSTHAFLAAKNSIAYSTSKAALSHLTRLLALEWAADGIRVNAVAPTVVPSAMTADVLADPAYLARKLGAIPLGRPIEAAHVAASISYLCSSDADSTTGQILVLDGGESLA
ncbi:NAD(P)-dependent dehydrogenase (short-subunit alcohol dehydrogenase family) [Glaciihabitans tibetensis]|uniref:NAD(P)-dependent dehydrogenase (Short-subunit alcohol dehydrogenase family) n=1 Tax=Glaciihabitans tibetensis TaxID=1266600 RepID=A0A2T0VJY8_9MICO|nr:SDR family oxidoreductase [Glaciihabitans tibetensis]PRY70522.1 NAD(P)-dependent dehydrogenase (short-subunit alcohol dehydrogenase family) [Glaciihabitans tibetensis]